MNTINTPAEKSSESLSKSKGGQGMSLAVAIASGLGQGAMLAFSVGLRSSDSASSPPFLIKIGIAFVIGFVVCFVYLNRLLAHREQTSLLFKRAGLIINILVAAFALLYPLRIPLSQMGGRLIGLGIAFFAIAGGITMITLIVHAAERQEAEEEALEAEEAKKVRTGSEDAASQG